MGTWSWLGPLLGGIGLSAVTGGIGAALAAPAAATAAGAGAAGAAGSAAGGAAANAATQTGAQIAGKSLMQTGLNQGVGTLAQGLRDATTPQQSFSQGTPRNVVSLANRRQQRGSPLQDNTAYLRGMVT